MKNYYLHILPGSVLPGLSIVRFCSKTSMAWLVIFCILSQHFFCINPTEYYLIVFAELRSQVRAGCHAAPALPTWRNSSRVRFAQLLICFILKYREPRRDNRKTGIKSALSGGGKVELVDSMIVRAAGIMFNLFVIPQNWFRLAKKKSRHEIDQKRTQPISSHTHNNPRPSQGREDGGFLETERGRGRVRCCKFTIRLCLH